MAKGGEFMETYEANLIADGENHRLELNSKTSILRIPFTDDSPNEIKSTFNHLIQRLKSEHFNFKLNDVGNDLFSQIAVEYVQQLNKELTTAYGELSHNGLLNPPTI